MQVLARSERVKLSGQISLVRNRGIFDPCRPCYSAINEPFAKTYLGMPPEYKSQIGISARDLQKHVAVHRSRIAAVFEIYRGDRARRIVSSMRRLGGARIYARPARALNGR